jgi:multiple sugar transport system ATP-binding protein
MPTVTIQNLYKRYKNNPPVLSDINLEVDDSEIVVLLGPAGSGKSTLLRVIAGLEEVSSGKIFIGNKLCNQVHPKDRNIGMVFQDQSHYPHLSVFENLEMPLLSKKLSKQEIRQRIHEVCEPLNIHKLYNAKPASLSSGELQKLALGRALIRNPKVFLLDEPLKSLDTQSRISALETIKEIHRKTQTAMIYTTHNLQEAMALGSRMVVLKDGFISQVDSPQELYQNPRNLFVAEFIGYPKMNFIHGELKKMGEQVGLSFKNHFISLDASKVRHVMNYSNASKKIILGIRPEHIKVITPEQADLNGVLKGVVKNIERLGSDSYLEMDASGISLTLKTSGNLSLLPDDPIHIGLLLKKAHIFDGETDQIISH